MHALLFKWTSEREILPWERLDRSSISTKISSNSTEQFTESLFLAYPNRPGKDSIEWVTL